MLEIENLNSTVENRTLRAVLLFCGQEVKDRLLYGGDKYYPVGGRTVRGLRIVNPNHT